MRLLLLLLLSSSLVAEPQVQLEALMGPRDQQSIGLSRLSAEERAALEAWINLWTIKTINQVLSMGCQCTTTECLRSLYQNVAPNMAPENEDRSTPFYRPARLRSTDSAQQIEAKDFSRVVNILRNGGIVRLDNGSVWEVASNFQSQASSWKRSDKVQLRPGSAYGRFVLNNLTRHQQIEVSQPGDPTHTDPYRSDPFRTDLYRAANTFILRNVINEGETVLLDNGSAFEVRLADRRRYVKFWHPGMSIEIFKKGGSYPYSLKDVQSGESVSARLKGG